MPVREVRTLPNGDGCASGARQAQASGPGEGREGASQAGEERHRPGVEGGIERYRIVTCSVDN